MIPSLVLIYKMYIIKLDSRILPDNIDTPREFLPKRNEVTC